MIMLDILEVIQQYGFTFGVVVVFILIAASIINSSAKRIKQQENKIDELYTKIEQLIKVPQTEEKNLTSKFVRYAENANKIQIQLYHLLQCFDAERVSIYEFHNGGKNLAGIEFKKCSNTYEAVSLETKPIIKEMQNLPLSINPLWSKILTTREDMNFASTEELEDAFFKSFLEGQSIKSYYSSILQDYDNTPIGFITLEYYKHSKILTMKNLIDFNETAIKIAVLINIK